MVVDVVVTHSHPLPHEASAHAETSLSEDLHTGCHTPALQMVVGVVVTHSHPLPHDASTHPENPL